MNDKLTGNLQVRRLPDGSYDTSVLNVDLSRPKDATELLKLIAERRRGRPSGSRIVQGSEAITEAFRGLRSAGIARPSQEEVAERLGVELSTFKRALKDFRSNGYEYPPLR
jgi:hypothetical protein